MATLRSWSGFVGNNPHKGMNYRTPPGYFAKKVIYQVGHYRMHLAKALRLQWSNRKEIIQGMEDDDWKVEW